MKSRRQISSGGIIFRVRNHQPEVVLIARRNSTIWCLPKGMLEQDETPEITAKRETKEETGLDGDILEKLGEINYWYYSREDQSRISKTVHFYLFEFKGGNEREHDSEADEVKWFSPEDAVRVLSYGNEKELMKKALALISTKYSEMQTN